MTNPIFHANTSEADIIAKNPKGTLIRKLDEQPPEYKFGDINEYVSHGFAWFYDGKVGVSLRYPSGTYRVKETWIETDKIRYKADYSYCEQALFDPPFNSPVTMPADAIRWEVDVVTSVEKHDDGIWYEINAYERRAV